MWIWRCGTAMAISMMVQKYRHVAVSHSKKIYSSISQHSLTHSDWAECGTSTEQYKRRRSYRCCFDVIIAQLADRTLLTQPQRMTDEAFGAFTVAESHWMRRYDWYNTILMDIRFSFSFFFFASLLFQLRFWRIAFIYSPMALAPTETSITTLSVLWRMNATIQLFWREIEMTNYPCIDDDDHWENDGTYSTCLRRCIRITKQINSLLFDEKNLSFLSNQREVVKTGNRIKIIMKPCHKFQWNMAESLMRWSYEFNWPPIRMRCCTCECV